MSALFEIRDLTKVFKLEAGLFAASGRHVWALNGVDLDIERGETYGLVGESGSGKTTLARTLVQLVSQTGGTIDYFPGAAEGGRPDTPWRVTTKERDRLRVFRSEVKYIFQDPSSSLDPRMNVETILTIGGRYNPGLEGKRAVRDRVDEVVEAVGLRSADLDRRPSEFSGGQRQRISLARALIHRPRAMICDEVVSALDVSIQGQILNLLVDLRRRFDLTLVFIAHDLTVVSYMADRIGVMYGGRLMEEAPAKALVRRPLHPYTKLLYESIPDWNKEPAGRSTTLGRPFVATVEPRGCPFVGRCPIAEGLCRTTIPELKVVDTAHRVACHLVAEQTDPPPA